MLTDILYLVLYPFTLWNAYTILIVGFFVVFLSFVLFFKFWAMR